LCVLSFETPLTAVHYIWVGKLFQGPLPLPLTLLSLVHKHEQSHLLQAVTLIADIQKVPCSNLGANTGCHEGFHGFLESVAVGITIIYGLDGGGIGVRVPLGSGVFSMSSRPTLEPTHPPIQWLP
jgi:hypothetical protein